MQLEKRLLKNSSGEYYVSVYFDDEIKATVDVWTGKFETQENFKQGLELVLENIRQFRSAKWLADLSLIEGGFEFARDYIADFVVPKAMKYGLRYEALVFPNNIFAMLSVSETLMYIDDLEIRIFGKVGEAIEWLNSMDDAKSRK